MSNPFSVRDPRTSIQKLKDVKLTNIAGGEILAYNTASQLWENSDSIITISDNNIISSSLEAGSSLTTGNFNVLLGQSAGLSITTGTQNIMIGANSGQNVNPNNTICLGYQAGFNASDDAICIGAQSGFQNCGENAVCIGSSAGFLRCGDHSVNIGTLASGNLTNGTTHDRSININATGSNSNSVANDSCVIKPIRNQSGNTVMQYNSTTGEVSHSNTLNGIDVNGNITMGQQINQNGVIIDAASSSTYNIITTLQQNFSGYLAQGKMNLGYQQCEFGLIDSTGTRRAVLVPHHSGVIFHWGPFSAQSDDRLKSYETDVFNATDTILKLESKFYKKHPGLITDDPQPDLSNVYHYNEYGFIAQKLLEDPVLSHFVSNNDMDDTYHVNYIEMIPLIVQTIKELEARIATLEA